MNTTRTDIVIRPADASDARALTRLAALDSAAAPLAGPDVLIAEVDGQPVAALHHGEAIADPFRPTASVIELLRLRAGQVDHAKRSRRAFRLPRIIARRPVHA
jgi:hypothetical protein